MGKASQALPFGAHTVWEDFADVDPDHRTMRKSEECDVCYQQPDKQIRTFVCCKIVATPARQAEVPTAPIRSNFLRPNLSMTDIAIMVKIKFVSPMNTACNPLEILLNPALAKISFR